MERFHHTYNLARSAAMLPLGATLAATPLIASGFSYTHNAESPGSDFHTKCTFSDGGTIAFDQKRGALGSMKPFPFALAST